MTTHCPFDNIQMKTTVQGLCSLGGFQYSILYCPKCQFESKSIDTPIEEVYHYVYDEQDFIGVRLTESETEPDRSYIKSFLRQYGQDQNNAVVLEIGPGSARNLLYAKTQGFKTVTLDVSETNNHYYKNTCNFDCVFNSFSEIEDDSVDLIMMTHVIEHVAEPLGMMREVYRIMRRGGVLLLSTPSTASLFRKCFHYHWWIYDIDDHVSFFNPANLAKLVTLAEFQVLTIKSSNTDAAHALSAFVKKKNCTLKEKPSEVEKPTLEAISQTQTFKTLCRSMVSQTIDSIFTPTAGLGLGYEVICIARK